MESAKSSRLNTSFPIEPSGWFNFAVYALLLGGVYYSALSQLITGDWGRDDYTYAYVIPLVVLYLVWEKRFKLLELSSVPSWKGIAPFVLGLALFWLGELGGEYFTLYISLWLVLVGLLWMHIGWHKIKTLAFALVVTLTMLPLPNFLHNKVSVKLQLISSQLGVAIIRLYGMPAFREGNIIDLGFTQLQVVEACSGLRYLFPLIVLGLLLAYFFKAALWKRTTLVISTVPLAIFANSARIALTGILYDHWGAKVAEAFFHGLSGWLIFMFTLAMLLLEIWILGKVRPSNSGTLIHEKASLDPPHPARLARARLPLRGPPSCQAERGGQGTSGQARAMAGRPNPHRRQSSYGASATLPQGEREPRGTSLSAGLRARNGASFILQPQFIVAVVLLSATLALAQGIEFREKIPIKRSFDQFPLKVGEWTGTRHNMEEKFVRALNLSDYVIIGYTNRLGRHVNFYVAYYESQRKGESIHSPATCLPGSGWIFNEAGATSLPIPGYNGDFMQVNRAFMQKSDYKQLAYYWFPQRGRILTNAYQLKIFAFWDALTKQRTDGALVRAITPVYESEELRDAEIRLQGFTRAIVPVLEEYIPGRDIE